MLPFPQHSTPTGSPSGGNALLRGGSIVAGVEVSVLVSETHKLSATATSLALESGARVSDHVIVNPAEVSVSFAMSNAGGGTDTARDVFETFKKMLEERTLLELITEHHAYDNMVITSLDPEHKAPHKGALSITLNLKQISFVNLQTVGREPDRLEPGDTAKTMSGPVNAGQQQAAALSASTARRLADAAGSVMSRVKKPATL